MFRTTLILSLVSLSWQGPFKASYYPEQKSSALEKQDWTKYLTQDGGEEQDWRQYMVGEQFFKDGADDSSEDEEYGDQYDYLPYKVLDKNEDYEKRYYPSAIYACNKTENYDTAKDPLAGLEDMNPFEVMKSKRYKKRLESKMFMNMFRYIQGVNKNFEEIEMTIPVVTQHDVVKEDPLGNYEDITMCFYLPHEYQPNHHEEEEDKSSEEQEDEVPDFSVDVGDEREGS